MKLEAYQARLQDLVKETVTLLCKNALPFNTGFGLDALICVTPDDASAFLLKLEETVGGDGDSSSRQRAPDEEAGDTVKVKDERPDDDGQLASTDQPQADVTAPEDTTSDYTAHGDTEPDDTTPDFSVFYVGSHDGSLNQLPATDDAGASGSRQVRELLLLIVFLS